MGSIACQRDTWQRVPNPVREEWKSKSDLSKKQSKSLITKGYRVADIIL